ncbi:hypothetical protein F5Y19DRAFT_59833 [Xylariaceae sp. FL1651]|nr:hypothetical protein F5Y19DRAFT_59833 [Xylariaceae sp. FL1651]
MQTYHLLQAVLLAGAVLARKDRRQVTLTVTATATASSSLLSFTAPSPIALSVPPVPWEQSSLVGQPVTALTSSAASLSVPMPIPASISTESATLALPPSPPSTASAAPAPDGSGSASGPKCGKGYTYCGYMLTGGGHNFAQNDIDKSYCDGLPELCAGGKHRTDAAQAVFICMNDQPSTVQLMCACSGTCLNNASSNYIAHCDKPCIND